MLDMACASYIFMLRLCTLLSKSKKWPVVAWKEREEETDQENVSISNRKIFITYKLIYIKMYTKLIANKIKFTHEFFSNWKKKQYHTHTQTNNIQNTPQMHYIFLLLSALCSNFTFNKLRYANDRKWNIMEILAEITMLVQYINSKRSKLIFNNIVLIFFYFSSRVFFLAKLTSIKNNEEQ